MNPYESWYGPDFRIEMKKSSFLRCYACASDMIEHMASETKRVFKGTTHKSSYIFYRDALSLMISNKFSSRWKKMVTKKCGYYPKWIHSPPTPYSNTTEADHLLIARNFVILIPVWMIIFTRHWIFVLDIHIYCIN